MILGGVFGRVSRQFFECEDLFQVGQDVMDRFSTRELSRKIAVGLVAVGAKGGALSADEI